MRAVEIKAVGLSDEEVDFCRRMDPALDVVIPPFGITTIHSPLDAKPPKWTGGLADANRLQAARAAATVPKYPPGLSAAAIVAHGAVTSLEVV